MKKVFIPCLLMFSFFSHAQTVNVSLSKEFSLNDRSLMSNITGTTYRIGDNYYCLEVIGKGMQLGYFAKLDKIKFSVNLHKYDVDMKEQGKLSIGNGEKEYGPFAPQAVIFNNKVLLFYYQAQEDHSIKLFFTPVDPESLAEMPAQELYTIREKNGGLFSMMSAIDKNKLNICKSPDQTKLMVSQSGNIDEVFSCVINSNLEIGESKVTVIDSKYKDFQLQNYFVDNNENKFSSYTYTLNKLNKRGVFVQNSQGKEAFIDFNTGKDEWEANRLAFYMTKDNSKLYVFANYYGNYFDEGILLSTIDGNALSFGATQLFPYDNDIRERMNKLGFGGKNKGDITVRRVDYNCYELEDGTIALTGYPTYTTTSTYTTGTGGTNTITTSEAGPIVNVFIKNAQCNFGLLYRKQANSDAAGFITIPYKNSLMCIYCDSKSNLESDNPDKVKSERNASSLVLVEAIIANDGKVQSKQQVADDPVGSNYYFLDYNQEANGNWIVPIGRTRTSFAKYYTEIVQWATIDVK